jgi:hypothetical protein
MKIPFARDFIQICPIAPQSGESTKEKLAFKDNDGGSNKLAPPAKAQKVSRICEINRYLRKQNFAELEKR